MSYPGALPKSPLSLLASLYRRFIGPGSHPRISPTHHLTFPLLLHFLLKSRIICSDSLCTRMSFSQDFFKDAQRTAVERLRFRILVLILIEAGQVVEPGGQIGMLGASRLLADGDGPPVERFRFPILSTII